MTLVPIAPIREVPRFRRMDRQKVLLAPIGLIAVDPPRFTVQRVRQHPGIVDVGGRGFDRMNQLGPTVDPNESVEKPSQPQR